MPRNSIFVALSVARPIHTYGRSRPRFRASTTLSCWRRGACPLMIRHWIVVASVCLGHSGVTSEKLNLDTHVGAHLQEPLDSETPDAEVRRAVRFVMTELRRLSSQYRYTTLVKCHRARAGQARMGGRNIFLDIEFDMLKGQPSRHDIIVFHDHAGAITGMAIDEFPEVTLREAMDPDV